MVFADLVEDQEVKQRGEKARVKFSLDLDTTNLAFHEVVVMEEIRRPSKDLVRQERGFTVQRTWTTFQGRLQHAKLGNDLSDPSFCSRQNVTTNRVSRIYNLSSIASN